MPAGNPSWVKGSPSGNPSGRPPGAAGLAAYVRRQTGDCQELVDRLLVMARDPDHQHHFAAIEALLNRAVGKPFAPVELHALVAAATAAEAPGFRLDLLSPEELRTLLDLTRKAQPAALPLEVSSG